MSDRPTHAKEDEEERRDWAELADELAFSAPPSEPPPSLRERLLERVRGESKSSAPPSSSAPASAGAPSIQVWKEWQPRAGSDDAANGGRDVLRAGEGEFEPTAIAGISVRRLFVDAHQRVASMLIRMAPGASYPPHRHAGDETCFVLEGDLRHEQQVMRSGDFERCSAGSKHGRQWTEQGCLLLVHSSLGDELLDEK
jgi:quercetin dioxygenase-like cupin family protein